MVNWTDPNVIQQSVQAEFGSLVGQFSIIIYEILNTLWFETGLLTRKIPFRWVSLWSSSTDLSR